IVLAAVAVAVVRGRSTPAPSGLPPTASAQATATLGEPVVTMPAPGPVASCVPTPGAPVAAAPALPEGRVNVLSAYPVDVLWRGKLVARGQASPQLSLPAGRQVLTLVAAEYAMKADIAIEVRPSTATEVAAPQLGRISIRANPDNCRVVVDGAFLDYPPILDRPLALGRHAVEFQWPDGARRVETIEVAKGTPTYVMGRKD